MIKHHMLSIQYDMELKWYQKNVLLTSETSVDHYRCPHLSLFCVCVDSALVHLLDCRTAGESGEMKENKNVAWMLLWNRNGFMKVSKVGLEMQNERKLNNITLYWIKPLLAHLHKKCRAISSSHSCSCCERRCYSLRRLIVRLWTEFSHT